MGYCYAFDYVAQWVTVMHFTMYLNGLLLCILLGISMRYCYAFYYVSQWVTVMHLTMVIRKRESGNTGRLFAFSIDLCRVG